MERSNNKCRPFCALIRSSLLSSSECALLIRISFTKKCAQRRFASHATIGANFFLRCDPLFRFDLLKNWVHCCHILWIFLLLSNYLLLTRLLWLNVQWPYKCRQRIYKYFQQVCLNVHLSYFGIWEKICFLIGRKNRFNGGGPCWIRCVYISVFSASSLSIVPLIWSWIKIRACNGSSNWTP